jgi:hypothetical protein
MKHILTVTLLLGVAVTGVYAHDKPVTMTFSGNGGASAINQGVPNTSNFEENVAGKGTLGAFTFRNISAGSNAPGASSTCSTVYFPRLAGGGILRFDDGSLLNVSLTQGGDCIDFVALVGHCTLSLKIIGGTGRFKNATGWLTYTETARGVVPEIGVPVLTTEEGEITGMISGVSEEPGPDHF